MPKSQSVKRKLAVSSNGPSKVRRSAKTSTNNATPTDVVAVEQKKHEPGAVLVFGEGIAGQLGLGEEATEKPKPTLIPGLNNIIDVAAGGMHTVCLTSEHKVVTFGCNDEGALGRDTTEEGSEFVPKEVEGLEGKVVQISAGDSHTAALTEKGHVYVWGSFRDSHGSMGLLNKKIEKKPVLLATKVKIVKIASGTHHLIMLGIDKNIYSCGCGEQGQLGRVSERGSSRNSRQGMGQLLIPTLIYFAPRLKLKFDDVWTGSFSTFAREIKNGDIYSFGLNNYQQIGLDSVGVNFHPMLSKCLSEKKWIKISGGEHHTVGLDTDGHVHTMGRKEYGRLGLGENCEDAVVPTQVTSLAGKKCIDVACGSFVTFAVLEDGKLYSWGMGSAQLGLGDEDDVHTPTEVRGKQLENKAVVKVSSGGQHTVILTKALKP